MYVGDDVGDGLGLADGSTVGLPEVGDGVGKAEVGLWVVGAMVGREDGDGEGMIVGESLGLGVGS